MEAPLTLEINYQKTIKISDKYNLIWERKDGNIKLTLENISESVGYNYSKTYNSDDKDINHIFENEKNQYTIEEEKNGKIKIIINAKYTIILDKHELTVNESILKLFNELKMLRESNEEKDKKIEEMKKNINQIQQINAESTGFKNEIKVFYDVGQKGKYKIFGEKFVKENKNNIELEINGNRTELTHEYELSNENNSVKMIIKNNLTNLQSMFEGCNKLNNIDELKYLNTNNDD